MNLENMFCEINPDRRNLHGGRLLSVGVQQRTPFGTQVPGAGAVHPHQATPYPESRWLFHKIRPVIDNDVRAWPTHKIAIA